MTVGKRVVEEGSNVITLHVNNLVMIRIIHMYKISVCKPCVKIQEAHQPWLSVKLDSFKR